MTKFDYLIVLVSIVIGLGVTQLLSSAGRLILVRERVRGIRIEPLDWVPIFWALVLFFVQVAIWYDYYNLKENQNWPEPAFFLFIMVPVLLSLLSILVLPDFAPEKSDLKEHYLKNYRWFFWVSAIAAILDMVPLDDWDKPLDWLAYFGTYFHLLFVILYTLAACFGPKNNKCWKLYHIILAPVVFLLYSVLIVLVAHFTKQ